MTKKVQGAKRGAPRQNRDWENALLADELISGRHTKFSIETKTKIGGKAKHNITSAYTSMMQKQKKLGHHDDANRRRLARDFRPDDNGPAAIGEDGEDLQSSRWMEDAADRVAKKHGTHLPTNIRNKQTDCG
jgi:hypothetical protein